MHTSIKMLKKVLALLLALVMILSLTACGSLAAAKTLRKIQKLNSFHVDCDMNLGFGLGFMGESISDLDLVIETNTDVSRGPLRGEGTMRMNVLDEPVEVLYYFEREDNTLTIYASPDGETWSKRTMDLGDGDSDFKLDAKSLLGISQFLSTFEETGTETINGSDASVYSGAISGDDLKASLDESGLVESFAEALDIDPDELELDEIGSIPLTFAIDSESGLPVKLTADFSGFMGSLLPFFLEVGLKAVAASEESEDMEKVTAMLSMMDISCSKFTVTAVLSEFDQVAEVLIPEDVINEAVDSSISVH